MVFKKISEEGRCMMEVYKLYKELLNRAAALVCVAGMPQSGKGTYIRELIAKLANADAMTFLHFSLAKETEYLMQKAFWMYVGKR